MKNTAILAFSLILASCASTTSTTGGDAASFDLDEAIQYCNSQVHRSLRNLCNDSTDYSMFPRNIQGNDSTWACRKGTPDEWCSGFWPGVLWYDYELTGDTLVRQMADRYTEELAYLSERPVFDHDLGFLMICSYGNGYRLTADSTYRRVLLNSADSLATLYNPHVGTLLSWPRNVEMFGGHNTIMDNMINLEMLFWASKHGGDKYLYDIAVKHAETTMEHHFRPDGTCYHVAVYDPEDGHFIKGVTHQGYSDSSTWARGQAWAVYGYTMVYRETRDKRFLDFACKVTDAYLSRLPEDKVPYWDFDDPAIPQAPRDASAAGVVASALLELQGYVGGEKGAEYRRNAVEMLASLNSPAYRSGSKRCSFLDHSTGHHPAGSEIDASIIYADYYYIEALARLKKLEKNGSALASL